MQQDKSQKAEKAHKSPVRGLVVALSKDGCTAKIKIDRIVVHPMYTKRMHRHSHVHADCSEAVRSSVAIDKLVDILPCRKRSKTKSWTVVSVIQA